MGERGEGLEELEEHMPHTPGPDGHQWEQGAVNGQEVREGYLHCEGYDWLSAHRSSSRWRWCDGIVKERGRKSTGTIYTSSFLTRAWRYCFGGGSASAAALPGRTDRGGKPIRSGSDFFSTFKVSRGHCWCTIQYNTTQTLTQLVRNEQSVGKGSRETHSSMAAVG